VRSGCTKEFLNIVEISSESKDGISMKAQENPNCCSTSRTEMQVDWNTECYDHKTESAEKKQESSRRSPSPTRNYCRHFCSRCYSSLINEFNKDSTCKQLCPHPGTYIAYKMKTVWDPKNTLVPKQGEIWTGHISFLYATISLSGKELQISIYFKFVLYKYM
jgi:hypothetical protein